MTKEEIYNFCRSFKNGAMGVEKNFARHFPEEYGDLKQWEFPDGFKFVQKLYHYLKDDKELELGRCGHCGKRATFRNMNLGYSEFCCNKCASSDESTRKKVNETCLERYGVENIMYLDETKERMKKSCLEHYGVEYPAQSDLVKEKVKKTNFERYGAEWGLGSEEIRNKSKETMLERYGVDSYTKTDEYKERAIETNLERYGTQWGLQNKAIRKKGKQTSMEKYGVEHPMKCQEVKQRVVDSIYEHYGVEHALQDSEIMKKMRDSLVERYGVDHNSKIQEVKESKIRNNRIRYGVDFYSQTEEYKEKTKATNLERYGVEWACMRQEARNYSAKSKINQRFAELLDVSGIEYEMEFPLGSFSYDFRIGDVLVEINPTITHNSLLDIFGNKPKESDYHINKTRYAMERGYRCIHIWDWDDVDKIVNIIKEKSKLYARDLVVREVKKKECDEFLNMYHLQNTCKGQTIRLGLYKDDTLVELMCFGKPRYNKNYEYELLRLCSKSDVFVVGGSEKLFAYFVKHFTPKSVVSYCDVSKFDGSVYAKLGFNATKESKPSKHWWNGSVHITDNLLRQRGFDQLFGTNFGKNTDNEELMIEHKFLPIYDCGQITYNINFELKNK